MKKLMILGGSRYAVPVIETAHKLGLYVITCDFLPDNIAHKYSDEYVNVSIIDKDAVLETAINLTIDGIVSFACDPGVSTAAYVAEKMGWPGHDTYKNANILHQKDLFKEFIQKLGLRAPVSVPFDNKESALEYIKTAEYPIIVKATDLTGGKGILKAENIEEAVKVRFHVSIMKR